MPSCCVSRVEKGYSGKTHTVNEQSCFGPMEMALCLTHTHTVGNSINPRV